MKWTASVEMTSATEGRFILNASPMPGWHLYGTDIPEGGPRATTLDFSASEGVEFIDEPIASCEPLSVEDPMFGITITWWNTPVSFTIPFVLADPDAGGVAAASVTYMACNDETCTPPETIKLSEKILPK